jgi:hypothetical protein
VGIVPDLQLVELNWCYVKSSEVTIAWYISCRWRRLELWLFLVIHCIFVSMNVDLLVVVYEDQVLLFLILSCMQLVAYTLYPR